MIFAFGDCEIHVERRELRRNEHVVHVEPQVLDLLLYLITHRDRVVSKDELLQAIWQGRFVSEATLSSRISAAREAIGDAGKRQIYVRTVARRGFRFHAPVVERAPAQLTSRPAAIGSQTTPSNLPAQVTSLIGRENAIADAAALLGSARLVTLTGVGGVGKTRLAIHVAGSIAADYPDGVWLIEFAALAEPAAAVHALAGTLGVAQQPGKTVEESLVDALRARRLLLVLDNCEHLIEAVAGLTHTILTRCPHVTALATSREALMIDGEHVWPVDPLDCDGIASPAVRLFIERARAVFPGFVLGTDADAVTDICRRLDGIPLAIELASARIRALSPAQIRDRLGEGFELLSTHARAREARHLTLRRTIQWSYDLLTPGERALFARLSVFAGGCALDAAEGVCGDDASRGSTVEVLDSLVRKSLVTMHRVDASLRYSQLEAIRQFAAEQLAVAGEVDAMRTRHARFFANESDAYFKTWRSPSQIDAYAWLDRELGNLRAAFRWGCDHDEVDAAARIASNIGDMARFRLRDEAAHWAGEIVDAARRLHHPRLIVLLTWAASTAWSVGDLNAAKRYGYEAISLVADETLDRFVWAFTDLAMVASYEGDMNQAIAWARAGASDPADGHDRFCLALIPYFLAVGGVPDEAKALARTIEPAVAATGVPLSMSVACWAKGKAFAGSDPAEALAAYERSIAIARASGNRFWEIMSVVELAALQASHGDPIVALHSFRQLIDLWRRSSDLIFVSHGLGSLIVLLERLGRAVPAAVLNGAIVKALGSNPFVPDLSGAVARVRVVLGATQFEAATHCGAQMELHAVHDYALNDVQTALDALDPRSTGAGL